MEEIEELTDAVLSYLETQEGAEVLMAKEISEHSLIHPDKLPSEIRELVNIHPNKLPSEIKRKMQNLYNPQRRNWISVDRRFADFYMTLLAAHLAERIGAGLLTDRIRNDRLANKVRLDAKLFISRGGRHRHEYDEYYYQNDTPLYLRQGLLVDLIFDRIKIDPDTPVKKILEFRRRHADELGHFRTKIAELTQSCFKRSTTRCAPPTSSGHLY